ncbi:MAG: DUF4115 domain-containing protein [Candidatus Omnitrophica bacterium]|nr:DUF4115 domain-containing protein [Candidatus Omnitrophota bacterium]
MTDTAQTESIGARLHKARLKKKATIDQVYKDIKIHPKIITALEEDRHDEFLNPTYGKAFLKSYCRYLELDASQIMADYDAARGKEPQQKMVMPVLSPAQLKEEKTPAFMDIDFKKYIAIAKKWLVPVAAGIIAVFLIFSLISLTAKAIKKAKNSASKKTAVAAAEQKEPAGVNKPLTIAKGEPLTLLVKAKGDVWLEVKSDSKTIFKSVLKKGSSETYKAADKFELWTGKGEFLDLSLNGNVLGSPGGGVIKSIVLTRDGLKVEKK